MAFGLCKTQCSVFLNANFLTFVNETSGASVNTSQHSLALRKRLQMLAELGFFTSEF